MLKVTLYKKEGCLSCEAAEALLKGYPVALTVYDVEKLHLLDIDEGREIQTWLAGKQISAYPHIVVMDGKKKIAGWSGELPTAEMVEHLIKQC